MPGVTLHRLQVSEDTAPSANAANMQAARGFHRVMPRGMRKQKDSGEWGHSPLRLFLIWRSARGPLCAGVQLRSVGAYQ